MANLISFHLCRKKNSLFTRLQKTKILTQYLMTATLLSFQTQSVVLNPYVLKPSRRLLALAAPLVTFSYRSDINDKQKQS